VLVKIDRAHPNLAGRRVGTGKEFVGPARRLRDFASATATPDLA
jgi:hypothetical protein